MKPIVFVGPTLTIAEVTGVLDADCRQHPAASDNPAATLDRLLLSTFLTLLPGQLCTSQSAS